MAINLKAVKGMAIVTALHQRAWSPDSEPSEVERDFPGICQQAEENLHWAGIIDTVTDDDILNAVWGVEI